MKAFTVAVLFLASWAAANQNTNPQDPEAGTVQVVTDVCDRQCNPDRNFQCPTGSAPNNPGEGVSDLYKSIGRILIVHQECWACCKLKQERSR
jgi:hypothetical protein